MAKAFQRHQINARLRKCIVACQPILGAGASAGIVAKCAEIGGADLLIVYSTGQSRLMGLPTSPLGDSNTITLRMIDEIANVARDTPIIGGVEPSDPQHMDIDRLISRFVDAGYHGLINFPTLGNFPERERLRADVGLGYDRDIEMMQIANNRDIWTMSYVFNPEQARAMAEVGTDCIVAHVGTTSGGLAGLTTSVRQIDLGLEQSESMFAAARAINPEIICLGHGGEISSPDDTRKLYQTTCAQGFVGASSVERIPIEKAVMDVAKAFKTIPLESNE